ncbi:MAG: rhodanese-like domain-containing protein [Candidatus Latescibacterota bacterium]|nr:rhodanese-like domain-containing protein [Candidatus Latescibacterota bacterium]
MLFAEIVVLVSLTAALTRFVRQAPQTEGLRLWVAQRSRLLDKLLTCPHCISFWIAVAGTAALWLLETRSPLEVGLMVLLGWRGAYYINRSMDQRRDQAIHRAGLSCSVCGAPYQEKVSIERGGLAFCSTACWFDYLRTRPTPRKNLVSRSGEIIPQEIYPLSYQNVTSKEAHELLEGGHGYIYVDVRSIPEFQNGHPAGAVNVPIFHREPMGMVPNPDFLTIVEAHYPRDAKLLIGCQSGQRSTHAAEALVAAGFQDVTNVKGGYGGVRDPSGQSVEPGWFEQSLPTEYGEPDERSYAALAGRRRESEQQ